VDFVKTYRNLYSKLCSYENLELAFKRAKKRKTLKDYVIEFESDLDNNLKMLKYELENFTYVPSPLTTFIVRDPKTRKVSASHFRDRVVHHALCNIIAPILEKYFIYDSFANQKKKGTHEAVKRFGKFLRKFYFVNQQSSKAQRKLFTNPYIMGYVLKADVRHYFDTVNHEILLNIVKGKIKDDGVIWLTKTILHNHKTEIDGTGMPIGNLTSQFFANVYLNELDQFVKHKLRVKYYIRYVDDFVILHNDKNLLAVWKGEIDRFLNSNLKLKLHPDKSRIVPLKSGITLLGFRVFYSHKLLKKSNARRIWKRLERFKEKYDMGEMTIGEVIQSMQGWLAYAEFANSYNFRKKVLERFNVLFFTNGSTYDKNRPEDVNRSHSKPGVGPVVRIDVPPVVVVDVEVAGKRPQR